LNAVGVAHCLLLSVAAVVVVLCPDDPDALQGLLHTEPLPLAANTPETKASPLLERALPHKRFVVIHTGKERSLAIPLQTSS